MRARPQPKLARVHPTKDCEDLLIEGSPGVRIIVVGSTIAVNGEPVSPTELASVLREHHRRDDPGFTLAVDRSSTGADAAPAVRALREAGVQGVGVAVDVGSRGPVTLPVTLPSVRRKGQRRVKLSRTPWTKVALTLRDCNAVFAP